MIHHDGLSGKMSHIQRACGIEPEQGKGKAKRKAQLKKLQQQADAGDSE